MVQEKNKQAQDPETQTISPPTEPVARPLNIIHFRAMIPLYLTRLVMRLLWCMLADCKKNEARDGPRSKISDQFNLSMLDGQHSTVAFLGRSSIVRCDTNKIGKI